MSREEAAAKALYRHMESEAAENGAILISPPADEYECCATAALAAADSHDAAHGIHRVTLDDATVERAAVALYDATWDADGATFEEAPATLQDHFRTVARAVLAAAMEAGQ